MATTPFTIADAAEALRQGSVSSVELTEDAIKAADRMDGDVGTFICRFNESALEAAAKADSELAAGLDKGPLHGIPLGIKDIIATDEGPTTAQSLILDPEWGMSGDAVVVSRLRHAGGIIMGKTTTCEFAIGMPDPEKPFPIPKNPWDVSCWPGGSSSGTGSGVAAGMFFGGLGTDTGGSIRMPAAFCGISGLKATFGRVPKSGCVPLGYSYDHIGPMTRSAKDCALMLQVLAGYDPSDPYVTDDTVDDYVSALSGSLEGVRIGVARPHVDLDITDPAVTSGFEDAVAVLTGAGATVIDVTIPYFWELHNATMIGMVGEAYAYHRNDLQSRWFDYQFGTRAALAGGALYTAGDYTQTQRVRRVGQLAINEMMTDLDLLVMPTAAVPSIPLAELSFDGLIDSLFTPTWNAVGLPALAIPMGFNATGLPTSLQIVGRPFEESLVLRAGDAYQQRTDWHLKSPALVEEVTHAAS
jgi:aspartyl-tRNA(Asn)/glutamyl-tRNA(Gln) amidotransferase subunit A